MGIEGTAHTFGIGICDNSRVLASEKVVYSEKEGIHPREAAAFHGKNAHLVLARALEAAGTKDFDLVAFSQGPGLGPCLRNAATIARSLACMKKIPVIAVNHCVAHVEIGRALLNVKDPLTLYVSGGNTQILGLESGRYRVFGETLDIAIGNLFDTFCRKADLGFPGGPIVEELASQGKKYVELPYTVKGMDLAFSGLLTAAVRSLHSETKEDVCFSLQETALSMAVEAFERALAHTGKKEMLLTGGVARNKRLQQMLASVAEDHEARYFAVPEEYAGDNGAMIAVLGEKMHDAGVRQTIAETRIDQRFRTDDVEVSWK